MRCQTILPNKKLLDFLQQEYFINWVKKGKIEIPKNGAIINIVNGPDEESPHSLSLILDDKNNKVNLYLDDDKIDALLLNTENEKKKIYKDCRENLPLGNFERRVNNFKRWVNRNIFSKIESWLKDLYYYVLFTKLNLPKNYMGIQVIAIGFILINMLIMFFMKDNIFFERIILLIAISISVFSLFVLLLCYMDEILRSEEKLLLTLLFLEFLYFPFFLFFLWDKSQLDFWQRDSYLFTFIFLIIALVIYASLKRNEYKIFNVPFNMLPIYPVTKEGKEKHMDYIENLFSRFYNKTSCWHVENFIPSSPNKKDKKGTILVSYPSKFILDKPSPVSIYVNGIEKSKQLYELFIESAHFEPNSFSMKLNEDTIIIWFLTPIKSGQARLTFGLRDNNKNNLYGLNALPHIENDFWGYAGYGITLLTMILPLFKLLSSIQT